MTLPRQPRSLRRDQATRQPNRSSSRTTHVNAETQLYLLTLQYLFRKRSAKDAVRQGDEYGR